MLTNNTFAGRGRVAGQVPKEFHKVAISYPATEFRRRPHTKDRACNRKYDVYIDAGVHATFVADDTILRATWTFLRTRGEQAQG